jgi:hypothetical protein
MIVVSLLRSTVSAVWFDLQMYINSIDIVKLVELGAISGN